MVDHRVERRPLVGQHRRGVERHVRGERHDLEPRRHVRRRRLTERRRQLSRSVPVRSERRASSVPARHTCCSRDARPGATRSPSSRSAAGRPVTRSAAVRDSTAAPSSTPHGPRSATHPTRSNSAGRRPPASGKNGTVGLWIDGTPGSTLGGLTNGSGRIDAARLGPQSIPSGVSGTEYFDGFASTTTRYIGP